MYRLKPKTDQFLVLMKSWLAIAQRLILHFTANIFIFFLQYKNIVFIISL